MAKRARVQVALRLPYEMVKALRELRAKPPHRGVTEQVESAIDTYLKSVGVDLTKGNSASRHAATRRKASARQQS